MSQTFETSAYLGCAPGALEMNLNSSIQMNLTATTTNIVDI